METRMEADDGRRQEAPRMYDGPSGWSAIKFMPDETGLRRAVVEASVGLRLFRFCVERYFFPADEDEGAWPWGFWQPELVSGLFGTADEAENIARKQFLAAPK